MIVDHLYLKSILSPVSDNRVTTVFLSVNGQYIQAPDVESSASDVTKVDSYPMFQLSLERNQHFVDTKLLFHLLGAIPVIVLLNGMVFLLSAYVIRKNSPINDFQFALDNDEYFMLYQPIISARTEGIAGFESLIRWKHAKLGIVSPNVFIPLAEQLGFMNKITSYVLNKVFEDWQYYDGKVYIKISVNVPGSYLLIEENRNVILTLNNRMAHKKLILSLK